MIEKRKKWIYGRRANAINEIHFLFSIFEVIFYFNSFVFIFNLIFNCLHLKFFRYLIKTLLNVFSFYFIVFFFCVQINDIWI